MPTSKARVKTGLINAYQVMRAANPDISVDDAMDMLLDAIAQVVVDEIKNVKLTYVSGLVAGVIPVTGVLNHTNT